MDDIQLNIEDPRQTSAKKIKVSVQKKAKKRTFWQYLFDLIIKTFLCALLIGLDFSLFANAGSYHLFSSAARLTPEAEWIYIGIAAVSFALVLLSSFSKHLEDAVLSLIFALFIIALINQFAVFEKHSGLLILFNGLFSDTVNAALYEYAFLIIGAVSFAVFFILLKLLKRQVLLYVTLGIAAVLGWVLSEAYLNPSSQYFKTIAKPTVQPESDQREDKNLIFLSFNDLSSPNVLRNIAKETDSAAVKESLNNALGFLTHNNFTIYPNAMVKDTDAFNNLIASYNPQSEAKASDLVLASTIKNGYFDFSTLQFEKSYLKENALYKLLKEEGYSINVYQTRGLDTCYVNNKLEASSCKEKVNTPINLSGDSLSITQKAVVLTSQWLESTGFVSSLNPILKGIGYIYTNKELAPLGFDPNRLYAVNAFKVFDQIIGTIDTQSGNQAYFAVIDLPSDAYVYDSFCRQKETGDWISGTDVSAAPATIDKKREAYAEQTSCLYGALEKFMQQLKKAGSLENTTIVIQGLNVPQKLNRIEQDVYRQMQNKYQVTLAIRPSEAETPLVDKAFCTVPEILTSYFITHEPCQEFSSVQTTETNLEKIKETVRTDDWKPEELSQAQEAFGEWFNGWAAHNAFENTFTIENKPEKAEDGSQIISEVKTLENVVEDEPEEKLESIAVAAEKAEEAEKTEKTEEEPADENNTEEVNEIKEIPEEVIPETLFDVDETPKKTTEPANIDAEEPVADKEPQAKPEPVPEINPDIKAAEEETSKAIQRAKQALADKEAQKEAAKREAEQKLNELSKNIEKVAKDEKLRDVLEAPVSTDKELSPEQLKEKLHQNINQTAQKAERAINIEIKVLDGKPNS